MKSSAISISSGRRTKPRIHIANQSYDGQITALKNPSLLIVSKDRHGSDSCRCRHTTVGFSAVTPGDKSGGLKGNREIPLLSHFLHHASAENAQQRSHNRGIKPAMMQRRTLRTTAWFLLFILSTIVIEGYDVVSDGNITEMFIGPIRGCFG